MVEALESGRGHITLEESYHNYTVRVCCVYDGIVYLPVDVSLMEEGERAYQEMVEEREKLFKFREEHRKTLLEAELKQRRKELESFVSYQIRCDYRQVCKQKRLGGLYVGFSRPR